MPKNKTQEAVQERGHPFLYSVSKLYETTNDDDGGPCGVRNDVEEWANLSVSSGLSPRRADFVRLGRTQTGSLIFFNGRMRDHDTNIRKPTGKSASFGRENISPRYICAFDISGELLSKNR